MGGGALFIVGGQTTYFWNKLLYEKSEPHSCAIGDNVIELMFVSCAL